MHHLLGSGHKQESMAGGDDIDLGFDEREVTVNAL